MSPSERGKVGERMKRLKQWRTLLGAELGLDPSLLWPTASLTRLARSPGSLTAELEGPDVRLWQVKEFDHSLRGVLSSLG